MSAIIFILCLAFLIIVHEFGHFLAAKKSGMKVEEFGVGLPPRIWGTKKGETIYSINALPFGGFVRIYGEDGSHEDEKDSFAAQKPSARLKILLAGIVMNLVVGIVLLGIGFNIGIPAVATKDNITYLKDIKLSVLEVQKDSPAALAGLKVGDRILEVSHGEEKISVPTAEELQSFTKKWGGEEINLRVERGKEILEIKATPRQNPEANQGALGISIGETGMLKYSFFQSIWEAIKGGFNIFINVFVGLFLFFKSLIVQGQMIGEVAGPIGIVALGGQTVKMGIGYLIQFLATLSIYLAAFNLIPFPALDGSRAFFVLIEQIRGKAVPVKIENLIHSIGFIILIGLVIVVTFHDVINLF